jgi:hypothetical protein
MPSRAFAPPAQGKLSVSQPGDQYEQEADLVAEQVLQMNVPSEPRGDNGPVNQEASVSRKVAPVSGAAASAEPGNHSVADNFMPRLGPGQPLDTTTRAFFEPRFGHGLGEVRVHAGSEAEVAARAVNARAFTLAHNIVFAAGEYEPHSARGRSLLAHELVHVAQQDFTTVRRSPYETRGVALGRGQIATQAGRGYWEQRTLATYFPLFAPRMNSDAEERDAVLATLWSINPPRTVTSPRVLLVPIAARPQPATAGQPPPVPAPALLYRFTFSPPAAGDPRPRVEMGFVASGPGTVPLPASAAPSSYQPGELSFRRFSGFPGSGADPDLDYFAAFPEEHRTLFQWMETSAPATFDQIITTTTTSVSRSRSTVTHRSVFHVRGTRSGTTLSNVNIDLVSQGTVDAQQTVPADYRSRGGGIDFELERLRNRTPAADRLGQVNLSASIPADEVVPVKYAIQQYFEFGNRARNTEVDTIVPVGEDARTVLYTLIFGANNDVSVTRIGETGTAAGQIAPERIDVTRVRGFPGTTATPARLRAWWTARYPQAGALTPDPQPAAPARGGAPAVAPPPAPTAAVLIGDMNRLIDAGLGPTWFARTYGIDVLDAGAMTTRLEHVHGAPSDRTNDTFAFDTRDLRMLELSLQTLADGELAHLRGIKVGRKRASIDRQRVRGNWVYRDGGPRQNGLTLWDGSEITVLYFSGSGDDRLYANNANLFRGSAAANVLPDVTMSVLHEFGHATGQHAGIKTAFDTWVRTHQQAPPTWYAVSNPSAELFPEAFALYHTDPHFLCSSSPLLYAWFETLSTSGSPPAANATLTAPASCP